MTTPAPHAPHEFVVSTAEENEVLGMNLALARAVMNGSAGVALLALVNISRLDSSGEILDRLVVRLSDAKAALRPDKKAVNSDLKRRLGRSP